jgi:hypothetical protein
VALRIEGLACIDKVDEMLIEGAPASDIAVFIQEDQELLGDVNPKTLTNALLERRQRKKAEVENFEAEAQHWSEAGGRPDIQEVGWRKKPQIPSVMAKAAYKRTKGGIEEINELEGLYLAARDRLDRLLDLEHRAGIFSEKTANEFAVAGNLLMQRLKARQVLGLIGHGSGDFHLHLDVDRYSEETIKVLQNPEKRHRIVSLLERMVRLRALPDVIDAE